MAGFRGGWRAQLRRHRPSDGCGDWTGTQLSSLAVCRSLSGSKSRSRPGGEARSISRAAGTSAAELLLAVQPAAGCCARETVLTMAQPVRTRCQTSSRWRQAHARRHGGINRCARCGGASCGAAHGSLCELRLLARLTRCCLVHAAGLLGTSFQTTGSRSG